MKIAMDICFREEKEEKRKLNMLKAREFEARFEEFVKMREKDKK